MALVSLSKSQVTIGNSRDEQSMFLTLAFQQGIGSHGGAQPDIVNLFSRKRLISRDGLTRPLFESSSNSFGRSIRVVGGILREELENELFW